MSLAGFLQNVITGILVGGIYALMSIGLALIFGVMRVVNFAQADFMMLGMYLTYFFYVAWGVNPLLGALVTIPRSISSVSWSTGPSWSTSPAGETRPARWMPSSS